jgi:hypothetical protein
VLIDDLWNEEETDVHYQLRKPIYGEEKKEEVETKKAQGCEPLT